MYNVLIADDDVDAWFKMSALLRKLLVKASFVSNLAAARQFLDQKTPSILFVDKQLQDNSTLDFIKYVRSKYPKTKIVMIDAHEEPAKDTKLLKADLTISKPLIPSIVELAINKLLLSSMQDFQPAY